MLSARGCMGALRLRHPSQALVREYRMWAHTHALFAQQASCSSPLQGFSSTWACAAPAERSKAARVATVRDIRQGERKIAPSPWREDSSRAHLQGRD